MAGNLDLSATLKLIDDISGPLRGIIDRSDKMSKSFERATRTVDAFNDSLAQVDRTGLNKVNQPLGRTNSLLTTARQHARGLVGDFALVLKGVTAVQRKTDSLARGFADTRRQMRQQVVNNALVVGGIAALASIPIKAFMDAEAATTNLKVSMMDSTGKIADGFDELTELAGNMGKKLPGSISDFQNMFDVLIKENISAERILDGVGEAAGQIGIIMKMEFGDSAKFVAQLSDATNVASKDMMEFMDIVQRIHHTGLDPEWIKQAFVGLSPGMKVLRMEGAKGIKALSPFLTMLGNSGMTEGGSAGNAMSKIFSRSLSLDVGDKLDSLKKDYGIDISMDFTDGKGEFGGIENFYKQMDKLSTLNSQQRTKVIETLYGTDKENLTALNILINKGQAGYDQTVKQMAVQASLQQRVNAQLGTLANLWDAAKGTFTSAMVTVVEVFTPEIKALVTNITDLVDRISKWVKENPELVKTIASLVVKFIKINAAIWAVKYGAALMFGTFFSMAASFIKFGATIMIFNAILAKLGISFWGKFRLMGKALLWFSKLFARTFWFLARQSLPFLIGAIGQLSVALLTSPIGWAILAIAVGALLIMKYWQPIKAFFTGMWDGFLTGIAPLQATFDSLGSMLSSTFEPLRPVLDIIITGIAWLGTALASLIAPFQATDAQLATATANGSQFGYILGTIVSLIAQVVAGLVGALALGFTTIGTAIGTFAGMVMVYGGIAVNYVAGIPSRMMAFLAGLPARMSAMGGDIMDGLKNGIIGKAQAVVDAILNVANRVKSAFTGVKGINSNSPSKVFTKYGGYIPDGITNGILSNNSPVNAMLQTSNSLRDAMDTSEIRFDNRKPISASAMNGAGGQGQPATINYNFTINAQPNQSEQQIADLVAATLAKQQRSQSNNNTAMYDLAEQW
ncbi:phage tail tape measure protein [Psychrobacter sp. 72-O-c]|uniref:phage tail tape measure protein n=1 Tax=Psychrobacter sp. 72-O-c TaxID=2774125 RepID=UPI0019188C79|nr:phage tail tape measure protein [Psychrobacter sp. 72-O-c]